MRDAFLWILALVSTVGAAVIPRRDEKSLCNERKSSEDEWNLRELLLASLRRPAPDLRVPYPDGRNALFNTVEVLAEKSPARRNEIRPKAIASEFQD